jgi:hypothetical protein
MTVLRIFTMIFALCAIGGLGVPADAHARGGFFHDSRVAGRSFIRMPVYSVLNFHPPTPIHPPEPVHPPSPCHSVCAGAF